MASFISLAVLAFAVSLDGFSVGITYGMRNIRTPLFSIAIICACSGVLIFFSMQLGSVMLRFISGDVAKVIGAAILIMIGLWSIVQMWMQNRSPAEHDVVKVQEKGRGEPSTLLHFEIKKLGLVIEILRKPSEADLDRSGNISAMEAAWLGVALSLDAVGAGIGAALISLPALYTSLLIAITCGFFLWTGLKVGSWASRLGWMKRMSLLPGLILIILGISKLF
ncbi:sporulation membrane protein YtaF [Marinicrinis lubricantis]|uniref:Sporulation membrane protein YtaF n=1 Tax=Marinicrinis lubricantis TaxID=2086470 RepID=A0ABW1IJ66_9BACL